MNRWLLVFLVLSLSGCAFYQKKYVSQIVVEGTNHQGATFTDGAFYINDEPDIEMDFSCFRQTSLGETVSLLIPIPVFNEATRHESIASLPFSLILKHEKSDAMDLSSLDIRVELPIGTYRLSFAGMREPEYQWDNEYEYTADLSCGDIEDGTLTIELAPGKVRIYGVRFEESIDRDFAWHTTLVT